MLGIIIIIYKYINSCWNIIELNEDSSKELNELLESYNILIT